MTTETVYFQQKNQNMMISNMPRTILLSRGALIAFAFVLLGFGSCTKDDLQSESVIQLNQTEYNAFDYWLQRNYETAYNIRFKYRYEDIESDMNYWTVPANYDESVKMAHLVKYLCLEAYDEVAGIDFTRSYFPKMIFVIGEWEYRNNGTYILGTAESGRKILFSGLNYLAQHMSSADELNSYYLETIHHEFTHILNQRQVYSADFKFITGTGYVADMWSESPYSSGFLKRGFISAYAQHSDREDFAEMMCKYVCNSESTWDRWMKEAGPEGSRLIQAKLEMIKSYMLNTFGLDLTAMRGSLQRRQNEVMQNRIDLMSLDN